VQRGLIGSIITRFEQKGYKLVALKMASPTKSHLECASISPAVWLCAAEPALVAHAGSTTLTWRRSRSSRA